MSASLGPIEVRCEAPAYQVVEAAAGAGLRSPWDVRWLRLDHLPERQAGTGGLFSVRRWLRCLGVGKPRQRHCTCGEEVAALKVRLFCGMNGYRLGQCPRCRTIFWDED